MSNEGKNVKAHYRGTLDDGTQFDSSYDRGEPIAFTCGAGQMIAGFDAAVKDMAVGEKKTVHIPAADAYGTSSSTTACTATRCSSISTTKPSTAATSTACSGRIGTGASYCTH